MASRAVLTLAVAGSRKTQTIVQECAALPTESRVLILTFTSNNQLELKRRLARYAGEHLQIEVQGWFSFLIRHIARPFIPFLFAERRVRGFNFDRPPQRYEKSDSIKRYLDDESRACRVHLAQLAFSINEASKGAPLNRLLRLYDRIYIDEVQDLCGYDLEVLRLLASAGIDLRMVGDVRQAVYVTNNQEAKNKKFMLMKIWDWFKLEEKAGRLTINQRSTTSRCRPEIAAFADSLFDPSHGFDATVSTNADVTGHDGVFFIKEAHLSDYFESYEPLMLRFSAGSAKHLEYPFVNFKNSKGLSARRVCIYPTDKIVKLLSKGTALEAQRAAEFYVAVTRAEQSVAIVLDVASCRNFPHWTP
jgi:DNA helicase II / ATP-dependent DNA helicase PcrA